MRKKRRNIFSLCARFQSRVVSSIVCILASTSHAVARAIADCLWSCSRAKGVDIALFRASIGLDNKLQGALCGWHEAGWHCDKWRGKGRGKVMDNWKAESATKLADEYIMYYMAGDFKHTHTHNKIVPK